MHSSIMNHKGTFIYLIAVTMIDYMGVGIVITLFPKLMLDPSMSILPAHWGHTARMIAIGIFLAVYPFGQFFGAAILGRLSDNVGRKKILFLTLLGTLIGFIASAVSIIIQSGALLFFGRLIAGLFAGNAAVAQASVADISTPESKMRYFSYLQIAMGVSFIIGPFLGGILSQISYSTPFLVISLLLVILLLITVFFHKETLKEPCKKKINLFSGLTKFNHAFVKTNLRIIFITWTLFNAGWWLFDAFLPTFLMQAFQFSSLQIGNFIASMGATYAFMQFVVVKRFSGGNPIRHIKYALISCSLAIISFIFIKNIFMLHVAITVFVTSMAFIIPGFMASISHFADPSEQGHAMGIAASLQALATVSMMAFGGFLEAINLSITILGGGALLLISWFIIVKVFRHYESSPTQRFTLPLSD